MLNEPNIEEISLRSRISLLVNDLTHRDKAIRDDAEEQIRHIGVEAIPPLIAAFERAYKVYRARDLRLWRIGEKLKSFGIALFILGTILALFGKTTLSKVGSGTLFVLSMNIGLALSAIGKRTPKRLSAIYDLLLNMDKPQVIAVILEMYNVDTIWLSDEAQDLMRRHIPRISPEQWKTLTAQQRKTFYRLLKVKGQSSLSSNYELTLAGLEALMQVGDAEAIPTVEYIAKHGSSETLRNTAYDCLEYLEIKRDEDSVRQTLLRASQNSGGKDELLRIPTHTPNTESEQLLRMPREGE